MVTISQFKAKCLGIIADVEREKRPVTITKNGRVVVRVVPFDDAQERVLFGRSAESTAIEGDLLGTGEAWDAEN